MQSEIRILLEIYCCCVCAGTRDQLAIAEFLFWGGGKSEVIRQIAWCLVSDLIGIYRLYCRPNFIVTFYRIWQHLPAGQIWTPYTAIRRYCWVPKVGPDPRFGVTLWGWKGRLPLNFWWSGFLLVFNGNYIPTMHRLATIYERYQQTNDQPTNVTTLYIV